jgi:putative flippase GtrA
MSMKKFANQMSYENFRRFFSFAIVGGFGTVLNTAILYVLTQKGMNFVLSSIIATEIAIISNFVGNNYLTFKDQNAEEKTYKKFLSFQLISLITLFGTVGLWNCWTSMGLCTHVWRKAASTLESNFNTSNVWLELCT